MALDREGLDRKGHIMTHFKDGIFLDIMIVMESRKIRSVFEFSDLDGWMMVSFHEAEGKTKNSVLDTMIMKRLWDLQVDGWI